MSFFPVKRNYGFEPTTTTRNILLKPGITKGGSAGTEVLATDDTDGADKDRRLHRSEISEPISRTTPVWLLLLSFHSRVSWAKPGYSLGFTKYANTRQDLRE